RGSHCRDASGRGQFAPARRAGTSWGTARGIVMTILGKILVIVNLLFSLVTGALIIMVFLTGTNWSAAYTNLDQKYTAARTSITALTAEVEEKEKKKQEVETALAAEKAARQKDALDSKQALDDRDTTVRGLQAQVESVKANLQAATADLKRREQEVTNLNAVAADKDKKLSDLENANKDFRDRAVAAELAFKSAEERNRLLLDQLEKMARDYERVLATRAGGTGSAGTAQNQRVPTLDLKGAVLESDPKSGLVTISLGSDSGLEVGNVLQVYRTEPTPEYVGAIQIVDTQYKQAVGRAKMPLRAGPIQKGDTVASRIR